MQISDINLDAISDPATRQLVGQLLNLIEALVAENTALRAEVQQLRDENARLKGGSAKPQIKPPVPAVAPDHSSEAERRTRSLVRPCVDEIYAELCLTERVTRARQAQRALCM